MVNVLIPTKPDDTHALYVKAALDKLGHHADLWFTADCPTYQTQSFDISQHQLHWQVSGIDLKIDNTQYDVVWYRRPTNPKLPGNLHIDDIQNAKKENLMFYQSMWQVILPHAKWINPVNQALRANSKILQLKMASQAGLKIPRTIISNDPVIIKQYLKNNPRNVIYKSLYPVAWFEPDAVRLTYTSAVNLTDLPDDALLQATPGIFQEKIDKAYELRITYFGDHYVAVKIHSQQHAKAMIDWRAAPTHELHLEQVRLPEDIHRKCLALMKQMKILFGCIDLIVTKDNEYFFLEINEQGQFLWIEEVNPDIKILNTFVCFLASFASHGTLAPSMPSISLVDFTTEVDDLQLKNMEKHINPERTIR